jgi:hypothetical protein
MKKKYLLTMVTAILGVLLLDLVASGQGTYDAEWHTVDGGGGVSTGSIFMVRGTAGQPDADVSSGLIYTVQGGFWGGAQGPPTAVTLASFTATPVGDNILVEWETAMEIDTVGFNVWRSETRDGGYVRVNDTPIPSASPGGVWGGTYSYVDSDVIPGTTTYYKLEELEISGGRNWYGPVSTGDDNPTSVILFKATAERTGYAALAWWLAGAAVTVGTGLVAIWRIRKRSAGTG